MVVRIGTSGWSYDHWHPELYSAELPPRGRLGRYAAVFPTAELNSSFYRWPAPAAFRSWHGRLPDGFRLSVKAPRGLTHARKLYAPEAWLQHDHLCAGSYPDADLNWWADRIREWNLAGQDVYVYFNNDGYANAVRNARSLQALLTPGGAT